jgi:aconitate hydratase
MSHFASDSFGARSALTTGAGVIQFFRLARLVESSVGAVDRLPFSIKVLLEAALRSENGREVTREDVLRLARYSPRAPEEAEVPFTPARVLLQDFTGVPAVVDLAAMRSAVARKGGDPTRVNPLVPVDLVIDHSVQVDAWSSPDALERNAALEFERNRERYSFLRWGQQAFRSFRVIPPASGIVHQVNLEYLASVVTRRADPIGELAFPDSLVGTDSHTTMIGGLGVLGWGVGGIEAEACMLGQPISMLLPEVIGFRLTGELPEGSTATDLVLRVTEILRAHGVVGKFVEFFGRGLSSMTLPDRATIANMAPEYGATIGFFPVDAETLRYLRRSGREAAHIELCERYSKEQGLFRTDQTPDPEFKETLELDLGSVRPALAGPKRPQDRIDLTRMKERWRHDLRAPVEQRGFGLSEAQTEESAAFRLPSGEGVLHHGDVVIAAITSCTNTSNPSVMLAAGLLARKAALAGLRPPPAVKASLAPGSKTVTRYLERAGLLSSLEQLGFHLVGYGCTTCIGNSGPLAEPIGRAVEEGKLVVASVLSGNRNFEGRVHPLVRANYLASPPLVVAYALAGTVAIDFEHEPIGRGADGRDRYLRELWPSAAELAELLEIAYDPESFRSVYTGIEDRNPRWNAIPVGGGALYPWDQASTYIQEPPFFQDLSAEPAPIRPIEGARVLLRVGDSVTTDHISPAGSIARQSAAAAYLLERGVEQKDFNSYGSRRGNDRVMTRGTFANIRLKNLLAPGTEGGVTIHLPSGELLSIHEASERYRAAGTPTIVLAGQDYGMGSSRDWAAKGTFLLGVRAVLACSFERIHRSNLVGMGVLPLEHLPGESAESLGLTGRERFRIPIDDRIKPRQTLSIEVTGEDSARRVIEVRCRIDTPVELDYYRHGGILHMVLRRLLRL